MSSNRPADCGPLWPVGCSIALVVGLVLALPVAWFMLFAPFQEPETGHLRTDATREVRLSPDAPVAALLVEVHHARSIFGDVQAAFVPTRMSISFVNPASGISVDLYPAAATALPALERSPHAHEVRWRIDCSQDRGGEGCTRHYVAVVSGTPTVDVSVEVAVVADLLFPPLTPSPFLSGIDLRLDEIELPEGAAPFDRELTGEFELGPDAPVTLQPLSVSGSAASELDGVVVTAEVAPIENPVPTGFGAPPPVVLSVIDSEGTILSQMEMRPAEMGRMAVPALASCDAVGCKEFYTLVGRWRDLADQRYAVSWRMAPADSTDDGPRLEAPGLDTPARIGRETVEGDSTVSLHEQPEMPGMKWEVAELLPDHLPAAAGVFRLTLTLRETASPITITLARDAGHAVVLRPGVETTVVMDPFWDCGPTYRCYAPAFEVVPTGRADGRVDEEPEAVTIHWRAELEVVELDPRSPAVPEIEVVDG
jgi:hypothetical protein